MSVLQTQVTIFGQDYIGNHMLCSTWKLHVKGRCEGDFKVKTENRAVLIESPYDMRTPFVSAQTLSQDLEGSVALQHNGLGVSPCFFETLNSP